MPLGLTPSAMAVHRAAWADLAARALEPSVFNDPSYALPAAVRMGGRRGPRFLAAWDPHDPARLIGLCCVAAPVPGLPLSAWLHPQATAAMPLLDRDHAGDAMAALLRASAGSIRPAGLLLHGLPEGGATLRLLAAMPAYALSRVAVRSRAVLRPGDAVGLGRGGKEMRRQARRFAEQGAVTLSVATTPTAVAAALDGFLALEGRGWKGRRGTALGQSPALTTFVRDMTGALAADGRCRIEQLALNGDPVAIGIVLRAGSTGYFWKTAFDERYARFSPGAHLADAIGQRQLSEPSLALTDSCAVPGHSMIDRLWPGRMDVVDVLIGPPSRALRLGLRAERLRRDLRARAKQLLRTRLSRPRS